MRPHSASEPRTGVTEGQEGGDTRILVTRLQGGLMTRLLSSPWGRTDRDEEETTGPLAGDTPTVTETSDELPAFSSPGRQVGGAHEVWFITQEHGDTRAICSCVTGSETHSL